MTKDSLVFHVVTALTVLLFSWGIYEHVAFWLQGNLRPGVKGTAGEKLSYVLGQVGQALGRSSTYRHVLSDAILLRQVLRESFSRWFMHFSMMWGLVGLFLIGSLGNMAMDLHLVSFTKDTPWFAAVNEVFGLMVLLGAAVAMTRRYIFGVHQLKSTLDDVVIMAGVGIGVLSGFFLEAARLNVEGVSAGVAAYSFVGQWGRQWLSAGWPWANIYPTVWWLHFLLGSGLGAYLPHSKLFHPLVTPLSVAAYSLREGGHQSAVRLGSRNKEQEKGSGFRVKGESQG